LGSAFGLDEIDGGEEASARSFPDAASRDGDGQMRLTVPVPPGWPLNVVGRDQNGPLSQAGETRAAHDRLEGRGYPQSD